MKVLVAPDSFKENLSARQVGEAIADGVRRGSAHCTCPVLPLADGGEGTVDAVVEATGGTLHHVDVTGPLGETVQAVFGVTGDGQTAVIEMASASGLPLVPTGKRNPLLTTTFGTGQLIRAALDEGVSKVLVGIGGSATVDGGVGMASALGVRFGGHAGEAAFGGGQLDHIETIDLSGRDARLNAVTIEAACDVDNPLVGPTGAAAVYGPQKGATPEQVRILETNLSHLADVIERDLGMDVRGLPGAGAAGGLGAGLVAFLGAKLRPGVEMVLETVKLEQHLVDAALVITAEGKLDGQTAYGKTPVGVARLAKRFGVPCVALAAVLEAGYETVYWEGVTACFAIADRPMSKQESMDRAGELLTKTAENVMRLVGQGRLKVGRSS